MASSGKKGKKNKGTVISLQSFLSDVDNPVGTTQVAKSIRNIDGEDSDEGEGVLTVVCQLPTAPRANRIFDDDAIPYKSPYIACITNLPFDVNEEDIYEYFNVNSVKSVRLPRDDGDTGRVRGFGYVEFDSRDDLIHALGMRDPIIKGRRIRINLSNENEQNSRQHGAKRGFDSTTNKLETRDLDNWRRDNTKRDSFNFGVERPLRDQKHLYDENNSPGSWRTKNRTDFPISSSVEQLNQEECNFHKNTTSQRPKLMLKPRTLPLPELDVANQESMTNVINPLKFAGTSAEKVFGLARPVDTTARDLEIEERLEDFRRQENLRQQIIKTTSDLNELSIVKDEEVTSLNWRTLNEDIKTSKNQDGKNFKSDTRRENVKENRRKSQEKSKGYDSQKKKEGKRKDTMKFKPELKIDRHVGKNVCNQNENIMSTNKYSGLEDDSE